MIKVFQRAALGASLMLFALRPLIIFAQCGEQVSTDPIPGGTYYPASGMVLEATGKVNAGSNSSVIFRSNNAIELKDGFEVTPSSTIDFHAQLLPARLAVVQFEDNDYPDVEPETYTYGFDDPVASSVLGTDESYVPSMSNRYFISVFGPRYKDNVPNGSFNFDFHQGEDIVDGNIPNEPEDDIICRCNGEVVRVDNEDGGVNDPEGKWVTVRCNETYAGNPEWGHIYMAYRHLHTIREGSGGGIWKKGDLINKGDIIGVMGETGVTENIHLHYSLQRKYCVSIDDNNYDKGAFYNVHPMRAFDPGEYPHLLDVLTDAEIFLLDYSANSALFRLAVPYNQANIRAIRVGLPDGSYQKTYDFEKVSQESAGEAMIRDQIEYVDGLLIYPYPFNRGQTAYNRYISKTYPSEYPGSAERGYAIPDEGIFATPAYVLDLEVKDLPEGYCLSDLQVSVIDIWGNGVKTVGDHAPVVNLYFDPADPDAISSRYVADNDLFFESGETIEIAASAFDMDGSVSKVELFVNGDLVDSDINTPFLFDVAAGSPAFTPGIWNVITAIATDNHGNTTVSDALKVFVSDNELISRRLTQNDADAEERSTGEVSTIDSYDLDLCYDVVDGIGKVKQYIGLWFNNVGIPPNAIIHQAYLQFAAKDAECGDILIDIAGEATDNPSIFDNSTKNISDRSATNAGIVWSPACWKSGVTNVEQRTTDIGAIVQETVNRSGWSSGNNMVFILENDNINVRRRAYSYHGCNNPASRKLTRLIVEYSTPPPPASNFIGVTPAQRASRPEPNGESTTNVLVYPNPNATDMVTLDIQVSAIAQEVSSEIVVTDVFGKQVLMQHLQAQGSSLVNLNIGTLPPGTYFIHISLNGRLFVQKIIRH